MPCHKWSLLVHMSTALIHGQALMMLYEIEPDPYVAFIVAQCIVCTTVHISKLVRSLSYAYVKCAYAGLTFHMQLCGVMTQYQSAPMCC